MAPRKEQKARELPTPTPPTTREPTSSAPTQPISSGAAASRELSSSAAAAPKDHLSSMSPELLSKVFALFNYSKPISGSLLAYTRPNRYRTIRTNTLKKLKALCDVIAKAPTLGALVQTLSLELRSGTKTPAKPTMIKLYESLNQLESLTLRGGLIDLILEHDVASTCFPQLSTLELNHPLQRSSNTLDVRRFACFAHYAKVTSLTVTIPFYGEVYEDESGDEDNAEKMMEAGAEAEREAVGHSGHETDLKYVASEGNGSITHLHLTAPCDDPRTHQFVEAFKSITHLTLIDPNLKDPNFTPFLSSYDRAPSIQSLHLRTEIGNFFITDLSHRDISLSLRRFTSLQSLILDTFTYTSTIFQYLRDPLPLKSLTLNRNGFGISTRDLKALFAPGPTRLSSLKTLVINTIYPGKIGTRAGSGDDYTINSRGLPPGWTLPVWDAEESFDAQGARELVQIAEEVGVKVKGTVIEALETEMAWKVDIEVAEELEGMEWEESGAWRDEEGWSGDDNVGAEAYD